MLNIRPAFVDMWELVDAFQEVEDVGLASVVLLEHHAFRGDCSCRLVWSRVFATTIGRIERSTH